MWNERYSETGFAYGTEPNDFLVASVPQLPAKSDILCLGEGEGRNAVYLAALGHRVTAVDASGVGLAKTRVLARERQVAVETIEADLKDYQIEPGSFQAIISIFCHLPPLLRKHLHRRVCDGLRPGGMFILEGYSKNQFDLDTGGPRQADLLMDLDELLLELDGLTFTHALETEREIHEGRYHNGIGAVVQLIGARPEL
jgi:SAM-dependent methyltransferase